jgi:hypothetical protein
MTVLLPKRKEQSPLKKVLIYFLSVFEILLKLLGVNKVSNTVTKQKKQPNNNQVVETEEDIESQPWFIEMRDRIRRELAEEAEQRKQARARKQKEEQEAEKAKKEKEAQERLQALAKEAEERRLKEEKEEKERKEAQERAKKAEEERLAREAEEMRQFREERARLLAQKAARAERRAAEEKAKREKEAQREKEEQERIAMTQKLLARQRELQAKLEREAAEEERRKQLAEKARQDRIRKEQEEKKAKELEEQENRERARQDLEIAENIQRSREEADRRKAAGIDKAIEIRDQRLAEVDRLAEEEKAKQRPIKVSLPNPRRTQSTTQGRRNSTNTAPIAIPDSPPSVATHQIRLEPEVLASPAPQPTVTESVTIRPQAAIAPSPPPPPIPPQQSRGPESAIPAQVVHISPETQLILQQMAMMARSIDNGQKEIIKLLKEQKESKLAKRKREDEAVKGEENFKKKLIDFISNNK